MHEEADGRVGKFGTDHSGEQHQVVVIHPDDVTLNVSRDNGVCKALVDGDILLERPRFVERLRLGCIGDCVVQTWPEDLRQNSDLDQHVTQAVRT